MKKVHPLVSVNMVVYNGEQYISEAIESILNQTYQNIELIIVNDGSQDKTKEIIFSFEDSRIKYYEHTINKGECAARNIALNFSNGKYIAVMDCDDISYSNRIENQIEFLEKYPQFGLVGSLADVIDENGQLTDRIQSYSGNDKLTKIILFFRNCFTHSTIIFKRQLLNKVGINYNRPIGVDYETIVKISRCAKIMNLNKVLIKTRHHPDSILKRDSDKIVCNLKEILKNQINELGLYPSEEELDIHFTMKKNTLNKCDRIFYKKVKWLEKLYIANKKSQIFAVPEFTEYLSQYWFNLINNPDQFSLRLFVNYIRSPFLLKSNKNGLDHLRYFIKCIIGYRNKNENE